MVKFGTIAALATMALTAVALPATAQATTYNNFNGATGTYGDNAVTPAGSFSDVFTFVLPSAGTATSFISSSGVGAANIDFTSVQMTGPNGYFANYANLISGVFEFRTFGPVALQAGTYTLNVIGTAGTAASYTGDFSFAAVPEPAAWALMIGGVSLVGMTLRRRNTTARVAIA